MTQKDILMKKLCSYKFAAHEIKLFLDTHPDDTKALKKLAEFEELSKACVEEYESKFGPIKRNSQKIQWWSWVNDPWPWEV